MRVSEERLREYAACSMYSSLPRKADWVYESSTQLLHWALLKRFKGDLVSLSKMRERFEYLFGQHNTSPRRLLDPEYVNGLRVGISVAKRVHDFIVEHEVIVPVTSYSCEFAGHEITGAYATVRKNHGKGMPMVLVEHRTWLRSQFDKPDFVGLCRYMHSMMKAEDDSVGIFHLALVWGRSWKQTDVREPLVHTWLKAILDSMVRGVQYPSAGYQCENYCAKTCLRVFHV